MRRAPLFLLVVVLAIVAGFLATPATASVPWVGFEDVPPSNTFYNDVMWLRDNGITRGCNPPDNTMFCPKRAVTRGEMAAFLSRALDLTDQGPGDWYIDDNDSIFQADINRIAQAGITKGCNPPDNTMFCPDRYVTRQEMASFLVRALGLDQGAGLDWFDDDDNSVHQANIDRLRAAWITFGCNPPTENHYCPTEPVTREQMAAFLHRALTQPAQGAALGVHGSTWPAELYYYEDMVATFQVRNRGTEPFTAVEAHPYAPEGFVWGDCRAEMVTGPTEVLGNGDPLFDPGELWDWYCAGPLVWNEDAMYLEASGRTAEDTTVSSYTRLSYQPLHPVVGSVVASEDAVAPGTEVTWTIDISNRAPQLQCVRILTEARLEGNGPYTQYRQPDEFVVGDTDDTLDPGEVWRYFFTATVWADTWLQVSGSYAPSWSPLSGSGWGYINTPPVRIVEPS